MLAGSITSSQISSVAGSTITGSQSIPKSTLPTGCVLQVVSTTLAPNSVSTTTSPWVQSNMTASITPSSSTSKVLVIVSCYLYVSASSATGCLTVYRNNTTNLASAGYGFATVFGNSSSIETAGSFNYLDSPATTSSTSYTVWVSRQDGAGTAYAGASNRNSTITLMEIAV